MKKTNKTTFIIRLIEGQTNALETFVAFIAITAISAVIIAIGNYISKTF
jgi:hypothetical protein